MPEADLPELPPAPPAFPRTAPGAPALASAAPLLVRSLERVRRQAARQAAGRLVLFALSAGTATLLLTVVLLAVRQSWARPAGWIVVCATVAAFLTEAVRRSHALARDDAAAARALGRVSPKDASDLLSAVELARAAGRDEPGLSLALIDAHLVRMGRRAARIDPRPAIDTRPLITAGALFAAIVTIHVLLFSLGGPRLRAAYAFLAGHGTSETTTLFAPEPIAGDITLTYRYPAHMNRPPRTVPGTAGDISAPKGTTIDLTARADRDVERAVAIVDLPGHPPTIVPLTVHGRALAGQLLITEAGDWKLRYMKASGAVVAEGPARPIAIEPDSVPEVRLLKPAAELEVSGHEVLTLSWSASDDYGLRALDLVWSTGHGAPEQRQRLDTFKDVPRRAGSDTSWDLAALGLQPGDRVVYHLEAFDNDSVSGGQTGKKGISDSQVLKVFSETEHHEEVLKQAGEQWERLVGGLGDRLEEPPAGPAGEKADAQWSAATRTKDGALTALATDMRALARKLADDRHAPPEIGRALAHVGTRLFTRVDATSQARRAVSYEPNVSTAGSFVATLNGEIREEEKDVLYLEDLLDHRRLLDLAALTRELQEGREQLADLVKQYKAAPTEENKQRVLAEVARLKERLNDLYRRMRSLAGDIQDEHLNMEARQMMENGDDVMSKLDQVQRSLSKGSGDDALKAVADLDKQLSKMEKEIDKSAGETSEENQKLKQDLQKLASDLMDVQGDQAQLKKETDDLRAKERQDFLQKSQRLAQDELVKKERERIRRARTELNAVDPRLADNVDPDGDLPKARDRLEQLDQALQAGDFDEAQGQAHQALDAAEQLRQRLAEEGSFQAWGTDPSDPGRSAGPLGQAAQHAGQAAAPTQQVADDLDKLMRDSSPSPSEADRRQMEEMGRRQSSLERRTEDLKGRLDKLLQQTPIAGPEQTQMLQGAADAMGGAHERLRGADSRGAASQESDAMQKLSQFAKSMRQRSGGQGESGEGGMPMPFGASGDEMASGDQEGQEGQDGQPVDDHSVQIPTADQSHAPAEFRRDLLNAMKDKAPDKYKERVRSYYEELVK